MQRFRSSVIYVLVAAILLLAAAQPARAGLAVSPMVQEISLRPGEQGKLVLNLMNRVRREFAAAESATLTIKDVTVLVGGQLDFKDAGTQKNSASKWISTSQKDVTLELGKSIPVELTITPPPQAEPGEYYSAIIVSLASHGKTAKGIEVQYEIASGVFVTVLGQTLSKQAKITSCGIQWPEPAATQPADSEPEPAKVAVVLKNTGPARFTATGKLQMVDLANGRVVMTAILTSHRPCVFGGDSRRFEAPLTKPLHPGRYAVKVDLDYESTWARAYQTEIIDLTPEQSALLSRIKDRESATAMAVNISPLKLSPSIAAGASRNLGVGIKSSTDVPVRCMLSVAATGDTNMDGWITIGAEDFRLAPSAHQSVAIRVAVPADAKSGTYAATLAVETWPEGSEVRRTEIPIEIQVKGMKN
jgi:hypothetical protein